MPAEQLFDKFVNIKALEDQEAKIVSIFTNIKKNLTNLQKLGGDINLAGNVGKVTSATKQYQDVLGKLATLQTQYNKQQQELLKLQKQLADAETKANGARQTKVKLTTEEKLANQENLKIEKERIRLAQASEGSYNQLNVQLEKATRIYKALGESQRTSARGQALNKFIDETNTKLKTLDAGQGKFQRNVGNYANSLGGLFGKVSDEIAKLKAKQDEITKRTVVTGFTTPEQQAALDKNNTALAELNNIMAIADKTGQSFNATVKQIGFQFSNVTAAGNQSEEFLQQFKVEAAHAKDAAQDLKDELKALSSDTRKLDLAVGTVNVLASALEAGAGAAALFGGNTDDVAKVTQKLVAIQSVANGVREVGEQLTKRGTAANVAYNFVLKQTQILFGAGAGAAAKFGAAIKLIGVGLLIAGIGFLISKLDIFGSSADSAADRTKGFEESLADLNDTIANTIELLKEGATKGNLLTFKAQIDAAEAAGASLQELYELKKKLADAELVLANEQFDAETKKAERESFNYSNSITGLNAIANAVQKYLTEQQDANIQLEQLQRKRIEIFRLGGSEDNTKELDKQIDAIKKVRDNAKQLYEEYSGAAVNLSEKQEFLDNLRIANAKRVADAERKAALELFKFREDLIQQQKEFESSDESAGAGSTKVQAAKAAAEAQKASLLAQYKFDISQKDLANSAKIHLEEEYAKNIEDINANLANKIVRIYMFEKNERLRLAQESSDEFDALQEKIAQARIDKQQAMFDKEQDEIAANRDQDLSNAIDNFEQGVTDLGTFNARKIKINEDYQKLVLESNIRFYERQRDLMKAAGEDTSKIDAAIKNAQAQLDSNRVDKMLSILDATKEINEQIRKNYEDTFFAIGKAFADVSLAIGERRKQQLQEEIDLIDIRKEKEIDAINQTSDSEEKKAARIKIVEAKADADKAARARKQKEIDRRAAVIANILQTAQLIANTVVEVAKIRAAASVAYATTLATIPAPVGIPIAIGVKASILAQIPGVIAGNVAAIAALAIKGFRHGGTVDKDQIAQVAEDGPELGKDAKGKMTLYKKRQYAALKKGTVIYPAQVTKDMLKASQGQVEGYNIVVNSVVKKDDGEKELQEDILYELKKFNKKPPVTVIVNDNIEATAYYQHQIKR